MKSFEWIVTQQRMSVIYYVHWKSFRLSVDVSWAHGWWSFLTNCDGHQRKEGEKNKGLIKENLAKKLKLIACHSIIQRLATDHKRWWEFIITRPHETVSSVCLSSLYDSRQFSTPCDQYGWFSLTPSPSRNKIFCVAPSIFLSKTPFSLHCVTLIYSTGKQRPTSPWNILHLIIIKTYMKAKYVLGNT